MATFPLPLSPPNPHYESIRVKEGLRKNQTPTSAFHSLFLHLLSFSCLARTRNPRDRSPSAVKGSWSFVGSLVRWSFLNCHQQDSAWSGEGPVRSVGGREFGFRPGAGSGVALPVTDGAVQEAVLPEAARSAAGDCRTRLR